MRTLTNEVPINTQLRAQHVVLPTTSLRIDLTLVAGDRVAVLGDASSITALLRTLARLDEPTDGHLWWGKHEVTHFKNRRLNRYRHTVAYVPANPYSLFDYYSPVERLFSRTERQQANLENLAQKVGLSPVLVRQQIKDLSGASLIRVALMRVLLGQPDVLLIDDVFGHVAVESWPALIETIRKIVGPEQALLVGSQHKAAVAQLQTRYFLTEGQLILKVK